MKNLAFHSSLRWKNVIQPILTEGMYFLSLEATWILILICCPSAHPGRPSSSPRSYGSSSAGHRRRCAECEYRRFRYRFGFGPWVVSNPSSCLTTPQGCPQMFVAIFRDRTLYSFLLVRQDLYWLQCKWFKLQTKVPNRVSNSWCLRLCSQLANFGTHFGRNSQLL